MFAFATVVILWARSGFFSKFNKNKWIKVTQKFCFQTTTKKTVLFIEIDQHFFGLVNLRVFFSFI